MPAANSLQSCLLTTTGEPLYVHPNLWSQQHLAALRVNGFKTTHTLQDVVPLSQITFRPKGKLWPDASGRWPKCPESQLDEPREALPSPDGSTELLGEWLYLIEKDLETYGLSHKGRSARSFRESELPIQFGRDVVDVFCWKCLHAYPSPDEYPISFPIVALWSARSEHYGFLKSKYDNEDYEMEAKWYKMRERASKEAEIVSLLIAMAQKQAESLKIDRFEDDDVLEDSRLWNFRPVLLATEGSTVRVITARISLSYLEGLTDMSKPLTDNLTIEQTEPLDLFEPTNLRRMLLVLSALVDEYASYAPLFAKRKPLAPGEIRQSLWWRMKMESIPYENISVDDEGGYKRGKPSKCPKRMPKTFSAR